MFCSTIIPTIQRDSLTAAVVSVLEQDFSADDFEVIVVNDSGRPLPPADWQRSPRVRVIDTNRRERCVARNAGAAVACGRYLHFLDDDDTLLPGALQALWEGARNPGVAWVCGGSLLVERDGRPIIELHPDVTPNCAVQAMAGEWVPLQASLIRSDAFHAAGGFNPLIPGIEDIDLARRLALHQDIAVTPVLVASIAMGEENSTTDYAGALIKGRWARESILTEPGTFRRLRLSATTAEWKGRLCRIYLTSSVWNLGRRRLFAASSRGLYALFSLVSTAGSVAFTAGFWKAVTRPYESPAFERGFRQAGRPVKYRESAGGKNSPGKSASGVTGR
jgi:glycosyltransferase involved in cell wall biosynthesis